MEFSQIEILVLENVKLSIANAEDFMTNANSSFLKPNEDQWDLNPNCLFYILVCMKLLDSLKEIHIKEGSRQFDINLYKLIKRYFAENNIQSNLKLFSFNDDSDTNSNYDWGMFRNNTHSLNE